MNLERADEFELWPDHFQSQDNEPGHGLVIHWPVSTFNVSETMADIHRRLGQMQSTEDKKIRLLTEDVTSLRARIADDHKLLMGMVNNNKRLSKMIKYLRVRIRDYSNTNLKQYTEIQKLKRELDQANYDANKYQNLLSATDNDLEELRAEKIAS